MHARPYQEKVYRKLQEIFGQEMVGIEHSVRKDATDVFIKLPIYSPRADVVVGPYNVDGDLIDENIENIRKEFDHPFIKKIVRDTCIERDMNPNPRYLMAIEVEFSGSSKHIIGDFANASMLGAIGVVIGQQSNIKMIRRVEEYIKLVRSKRVGKAPKDLFKNVVTFEATTFLELFESQNT